MVADMTPREHKALMFIQTYNLDHGYSPSYVEIAEHMGVKSKSSITRVVRSLIDQGRLQQRHRKARGVDPVALTDVGKVVEENRRLRVALAYAAPWAAFGLGESHNGMRTIRDAGITYQPITIEEVYHRLGEGAASRLRGDGGLSGL